MFLPWLGRFALTAYNFFNITIYPFMILLLEVSMIWPCDARASLGSWQSYITQKYLNSVLPFC
jgi:hypothetical protein